MIFGIDYQAAVSPERSGIGVYIYNLVRAISQIDKENDYKLFVPHAGKTIEVISSKIKFVGRKNIIHRLIKLDAFHGPDFKLIPLRAGKKIVTIHDLASRIDGDFMSDEFRQLTRLKIEKSISRADVIVTVSKTIKNQLEEYYPITRGKIRVVYHGISDDIVSSYSEEVRNDVLLKHGITSPYLLFVGNLETRKNLTTLIKAFQLFIEQNKSSHHLVLVGKPGWGYEKITKVFEESRIKEKIHFIGWINNQDISDLYTNADLFVFPSLYEGFGFPLLEAMRCGVPVVASDIPTHREIAGDSALFVLPNNISGYLDAFNQILSSRSKAESLIRSGKEHSQYFTWKKAAQAMIDIYSG
ncbi:MAG: glycosyltransferase family 4 protein [Ignavibacteriales bacterium]|nr:glycosyltransferase family 4 protein [Ignavibacteriales bacterium]